MRILEILLVISTIASILCLIFLKRQSCKKIFVLSCVNVLVLLFHLFLEGYRWQLIPVYGISAGVFIFTAFSSFSTREHSDTKVSRILKNILCIFLVIFTFLSSGLSIGLPVFKTPNPTGSFPVGTQILHFVDENRAETFTENPNDKRELIVQVWYPAQNIDGKNPLALMPDENTFFTESLNEDIKNEGVSRFIGDYIKYIRSHSYENAEVSDSNASYPMVLLSHGYGMSRLMYACQAENLASHGYIVVGIDYTYYAAATKFPDGRVARLDMNSLSKDRKESYDNLSNAWSGLYKDVSFIIDQFYKIDNGEIKNILKDRIDLGNIGAMGHSLGGAVAFDACYSDSRIKAGINMDGLLYGAGSKKSLDKPFLFLFSDSYMKIVKAINSGKLPGEMQGMDKAAQEYVTNIYKQIYGIFDQTAKNGGYIMHIKRMEHNNFTDLQIYSPLLKYMGLTGQIDGNRGLNIINSYVLDFFDKYLKGKGGDLLAKPRSEYAEVEFIKQLQ